MNEPLPIDVSAILPADHAEAALAGRVMTVDGPCVVVVRDGRAQDVTASFPTIAHLLNADDPVAALRGATGPDLGSVAELAANADEAARDSAKPWLLAPVDIQALRACGVTFVKSMLERVIEEMAKGDPAQAGTIRAEIGGAISGEIQGVVPGSAEALKVRALLQEKNLWSQYLEVGLGEDAEIFTKAQPMSAIGFGATAGLHPASSWNNPEPEVVLIAGRGGRIIGATLGNDVNLRDIEGKSALLLGRAKDNNGSCVIGPFLRLLDGGFDLDALRVQELSLIIRGLDNFRLEDSSPLAEISRDIADLMAQAFDCHQYPDGLALFTGTMFAPVQDRDAPGEGFTHKVGDVVEIASERLGTLAHRIDRADRNAPWEFGVAALMASLAARGIAV